MVSCLFGNICLTANYLISILALELNSWVLSISNSTQSHWILKYQISEPGKLKVSAWNLSILWRYCPEGFTTYRSYLNGDLPGQVNNEGQIGQVCKLAVFQTDVVHRCGWFGPPTSFKKLGNFTYNFVYFPVLKKLKTWQEGTHILALRWEPGAKQKRLLSGELFPPVSRSPYDSFVSHSRPACPFMLPY